MIADVRGHKRTIGGFVQKMINFSIGSGMPEEVKAHAMDMEKAQTSTAFLHSFRFLRLALIEWYDEVACNPPAACAVEEAFNECSDLLIDGVLCFKE